MGICSGRGYGEADALNSLDFPRFPPGFLGFPPDFHRLSPDLRLISLEFFRISAGFPARCPFCFLEVVIPSGSEFGTPQSKHSFEYARGSGWEGTTAEHFCHLTGMLSGTTIVASLVIRGRRCASHYSGDFALK